MGTYDLVMTQNHTCTESFDQIFSKDCWWYSVLILVVGLLIVIGIFGGLAFLFLKFCKQCKLRCCTKDPPSRNSFSEALDRETKRQNYNKFTNDCYFLNFCLPK